MIWKNGNYSSSRKWLTSDQQFNRVKARLFCFPYSGSGASIYYNWKSSFPPEINIFPVQLPGRESRLNENLHTKLFKLVKKVTDEIAPFLDVPFAFFGHSMGALLSFELARFLRRERHIVPQHLFISSHSAPQATIIDEPIHQLPNPIFIQRLQELNGTPDEIFTNAELLELILPILRADFALCETYSYKKEAPLDCPITVFGGLGDPFLGRNDLEKWGVQTKGLFKLRMLPGDHFYLRHQQPQLLHIVARDLLYQKG